MHFRFRFLLFVVFVSLISCREKEVTDEELVENYCGSCHLVPSPDLLDKRTWYNNVLPQMKFRMGFPDKKIVRSLSPNDRKLVLDLLPDQPMLSEAEWDRIFNYYVKNSPESLTQKAETYSRDLSQFEVSSFSDIPPLITALSFDSVLQRLYIGNSFNYLYSFDSDLKKLDTLKLPSTPSSITPLNGEIMVSLMGIMQPNDQAIGKLLIVDKENFAAFETVLDSLRRPVFAADADFNGDGVADWLVCNFGNFIGSVDIFERNKHNPSLVKHTISSSPGARNVVTKDFDLDGRLDFMVLVTQGDERIVLYLNQGNFKFKEKVILRFPPVYGSSFFEIHDFNGDGKFDILYSNGDNADYSNIIKPYHGVRIFQNNGNYDFEETYFAPMPGAYQVSAHDFDGDGDLDMAAVSFFPDFENQQGNFIYFENKGQNVFEKRIHEQTLRGRWLTMEVADIDQDKDQDIIIGALSVKGIGATDRVYTAWMRNYASLLIFRNKLH